MRAYNRLMAPLRSVLAVATALLIWPFLLCASPETKEECLQSEGPAIKRAIQPTYPEMARRGRVMGDVCVEVSVRYGAVRKVAVLVGHPLLAPAAAKAAAQWRFFSELDSSERRMKVLFKFVFSCDNLDEIPHPLSLPPFQTVTSARNVPVTVSTTEKGCLPSDACPNDPVEEGSIPRGLDR